jgi:hypothetical protein
LLMGLLFSAIVPDCRSSYMVKQGTVAMRMDFGRSPKREAQTCD